MEVSNPVCPEQALIASSQLPSETERAPHFLSVVFPFFLSLNTMVGIIHVASIPACLFMWVLAFLHSLCPPGVNGDKRVIIFNKCSDHSLNLFGY